MSVHVPRTRVNRKPKDGATHKPKSSAWIRPTRRRAIYLRDGLTCAYCSADPTTNPYVELTLDHIVPRSAGGGHEASNLITCCKSCNSSRKGTDLFEWLGRKRAKQIRRQARKPLAPHLLEVGIEREVQQRVDERIQNLMALGWLYQDASNTDPPF